jgi:hypothetical protein
MHCARQHKQKLALAPDHQHHMLWLEAARQFL